MLRRSLLFRTGHPMFAILAIWCMGCSSFDTLLDQAFGGSASAQSVCMTADVSQDLATQALIPAVQAEGDQGDELGCGCSHCVGVSAVAASASIVGHPTPEALIGKIGRALRADRQPLVPPPQGIVRI